VLDSTHQQGVEQDHQPERSQLLQILPSLTVKQFFSGSAYFSCCANIGGCLVFPVRQHFCRHQYFSMRQGFSIHQRFWMRQCFCIRRGFWRCQCFCIRQGFGCAYVFVYICGAYIFVYFSAFLFSMCQLFNWRKCYEVFRLRLIIVVMIMYCVFMIIINIFY
jgi:hypothetical protein